MDSVWRRASLRCHRVGCQGRLGRAWIVRTFCATSILIVLIFLFFQKKTLRACCLLHLRPPQPPCVRITARYAATPLSPQAKRPPCPSSSCLAPIYPVETEKEIETWAWWGSPALRCALQPGAFFCSNWSLAHPLGSTREALCCAHDEFDGVVATGCMRRPRRA